jgi:hypothetical protein
MNEGELLQFLKDNYIADLKPSEDKFSRWDCTSDKYKYRIELKCRNKHYNELILEKDKYFALINSYKKNKINRCILKYNYYICL